MTIFRQSRTLLIAAGTALILLAGCSRSAPDPAEDKDTTAAEAPAAPAPAPEPAPEAKPVEKTARADIPPEPEPAPEAQMQDDADATGMTAHVSPDTPASDNVDSPADPAKGE